MRLRYLKNITPAVLAAVLTAGTVSCSDDLNQSIKDPQTNTEFDATASLAKIYGSMHLTGQKGATDDPDMSQFDEGNSAFFRRIFEANELPTDECIWTWQNDAGIPELTNISWDSSHGYNELTYYRIMYNITLCNSYLDNTEGSTESGMAQNRAEVRFMRALFYYYFIDLYGKAPFKEHVSTDLPVQYNRQQAYDYVISELKSINGETADATEVLMDYAGADNYGRADKVAANMLLARLYLNAEVYTGTAQWQLAADYATKVINSNYKLYDGDVANSYPAYTRYEQLFMGDNGENAGARNEIIFPIRCDGATSRSYGGSLYPIASTKGTGPDQGLSDGGTAWTCNRARMAMVDKFFSSGSAPLEADVAAMTSAAGDDRAMFYSVGRTYETEEKTTFTSGFSILKWSNVHADGSSPKAAAFPDTDVPFMRVAEAYLTRAEANYRLSGSSSAVTDDINKLRRRANASTVNVINNVNEILDEWCREFYFEGRRRSDLVRFGLFTSADYLWDWKGGSYTGAGVQSKYNVYPIPYNEINSNPNMTQNPDY